MEVIKVSIEIKTTKTRVYGGVDDGVGVGEELGIKSQFGVFVGVGVTLTPGVGVGDKDIVGVGVGDPDGVIDALGVGVGDPDGDKDIVGVGVGDPDGVIDALGVGVGDEDSDIVGVGVGDPDGVIDALGVGVIDEDNDIVGVIEGVIEMVGVGEAVIAKEEIRYNSPFELMGIPIHRGEEPSTIFLIAFLLSNSDWPEFFFISLLFWNFDFFPFIENKISLYCFLHLLYLELTCSEIILSVPIAK